MLKVVTDVLTAMDRRQITLLGMFNLSAAFDTVDHAILLRWLEVSFGIRGVELNWFASYLSGRSQQVSVHGTLALSTFLEYGVPQCSVLGPVLFLMYTADLVSFRVVFVVKTSGGINIKIDEKLRKNRGKIEEKLSFLQPLGGQSPLSPLQIPPWLAWCTPLVCLHMHMQMIFRFTAIFLLGRNTLHCNVFRSCSDSVSR